VTELLDWLGRPRIVITGVGALTPLASDVPASWQSLLAGRSGIARITAFDPEGLPCTIAGEVDDFDPARYMPAKEARRMARVSQLAVAAAREAIRDAGFGEEVPDPVRCGVVVGTGMGGLERAFHDYDVYRERGLGKVSPFALISPLPNMPSHHVSLVSQAQGPISTVVAACATGTQAIGEGAEMIRRGAADRILSGGSEGLIHPAAMAGFAAMRALSTSWNDEPERSCRPFEADRDGFILSEGAGIVLLERLDLALDRGAKIYAEFVGHSSSSDAFHVARPDPQGKGAQRAIRWAIEDAGIEPAAIDYVNAHGTGTQMNDMVETYAIKQVLGAAAHKVQISSTKSMTGHMMGAAGAIEAIFSALALRDGIIPPTINYETADPACDLDYVPNKARKSDLTYAMSNSFGLGGQNACLVLKKYDQS